MTTETKLTAEIAQGDTVKLAGGFRFRVEAVEVDDRGRTYWTGHRSRGPGSIVDGATRRRVPADTRWALA